MGNLFDFLMLILSVIDISVFGNWVQMLSSYLALIAFTSSVKSFPAFAVSYT